MADGVLMEPNMPPMDTTPIPATLTLTLVLMLRQPVTVCLSSPCDCLVIVIWFRRVMVSLHAIRGRVKVSRVKGKIRVRSWPSVYQAPGTDLLACAHYTDCVLWPPTTVYGYG